MGAKRAARGPVPEAASARARRARARGRRRTSLAGGGVHLNSSYLLGGGLDPPRDDLSSRGGVEPENEPLKTPKIELRTLKITENRQFFPRDPIVSSRGGVQTPP